MIWLQNLGRVLASIFWFAFLGGIAKQDFIEKWLLQGLVGSYMLGSFLGTLAPGIPLWTLHRLGEVYGRAYALAKGKAR